MRRERSAIPVIPHTGVGEAQGIVLRGAMDGEDQAKTIEQRRLQHRKAVA
jgi:hypothetical protein